MSVADAAAWADVLMMLAPDELQRDIYNDEIAPNIRDGAALLFAHGLNIHFDLIEPKPTIDVLMVAPKGPGHTVRGEYQKGGGVPCLIAVHQNATGGTPWTSAWPTPRPSAAAARASSRPTSARNARPTCSASRRVLCGGLVELIRAGFETLVEAGYAPEMAYFECLHEVKLIVDLIYEGGIANMNYSISNTAEYGEYVTGPRIVTAETKAEMKRVLEDIQSGRFVRDFMVGERRRPAQLQGHPPPRRRASDRGSRRAPARHDALDHQEQAGRQGAQLTATRADPPCKYRPWSSGGCTGRRSRCFRPSPAPPRRAGSPRPRACAWPRRGRAGPAAAADAAAPCRS